MIKKLNRGEISTAMIVTFIILIASFLIIIFFYSKANLGKTSDEEVCHNSVVARGSGVLPKETIPLNCKTSYICITKDGTCEDMTNPEVEKVSTADEVYNSLAVQMAGCWWMFGEGKLNYVGKDFNSQLYCSLCSQIDFDNSLSKIFPDGKINKEDFYNYLSSNNAPGKDTSYLDYLEGLKSSGAIKDALQTNKYEFGNMTIGHQYYVAMGIFSEVSIAKWAVLGVGASALSFITVPLSIILGPLGAPISMIVSLSSNPIAGAEIGTLVGIIVKGESEHSYLSPTIIEANSQEFGKLNCSDIKTLA